MPTVSVVLPSGKTVLDNVYLGPEQTVSVLREQVSGSLPDRMCRLVSSAGRTRSANETIKTCGLGDQDVVTAVAFEGVNIDMAPLKKGMGSPSR